MKFACLPVLLSLGAAGCGTYVPPAIDWASSGDDTADTAILVAAIVQSVECELQKTVTEIVDKENGFSSLRDNKKNYVEFLEKWGAEVALTLTITENSNVSPSVLLTPPSGPSSIFTMSGGFSVSGKATRVEKINLFYTVRELNKPGSSCEKGRNSNSFLVNSDLKIAAILESRLLLPVLGRGPSSPQGPKLIGKSNGLTHQVTFQVVSSGNVTPTWRMVRASVSPTGTLFSTGRDRTHDLVVTFGQLDGDPGSRALVKTAQESHFLAQFNSGVAASVASTLPR